MAPKLDAAARFATDGGTAIVSSLEHAARAMAGTAGTRIAGRAGRTAAFASGRA